MARRSVVIDYIDEIPEIRILPGDRRYDYVSCEAEGPLQELMRCEVNAILRNARLTALEAGIVDCHLRGYKDKAIAAGYNRMLNTERYNRNAIKTIRLQAFRKLANYPDLGVLTTLLSEFPIRWVRECLSEREIKKYCLD